MAFAFILKHWSLLAIALLLAAVGFQEVRVNRAHTQTAEVRETLAAERVTYAQAAASAQLAARVEESRRETEKQESIRHAQEQIALAESNAAGARTAADRLRQQVAALVASGRRGTSNPGAPAGSTAADTNLDLLVNVLDRHSRELVAVGAFADRSRIAGQACERAYDSLSK